MEDSVICRLLKQIDTKRHEGRTDELTENLAEKWFLFLSLLIGGTKLPVNWLLPSNNTRDETLFVFPYLLHQSLGIVLALHNSRSRFYPDKLGRPAVHIHLKIVSSFFLFS